MVDCPLTFRSIGCIFGELLHHAPILPGTSEPSQLGLIVDLLGKPNAQIWPTITSLPLYGTIQLPEQKFNNLRSRFASATSKTLELLGSLLRYDPHKRISVSDALQHLYFYEVPSVYDHVWFQNVKRGLAVRLRATPQEQKPVNKDKMSDSVVQKLIAQSTPTGYFYNDPKRAYGMDEMSKWAKRELVVSPPPRNKRIPKKRRNQ